MVVVSIANVTNHNSRCYTTTSLLRTSVRSRIRWLSSFSARQRRQLFKLDELTTSTFQSSCSTTSWLTVGRRSSGCCLPITLHVFAGFTYRKFHVPFYIVSFCIKHKACNGLFIFMRSAGFSVSTLRRSWVLGECGPPIMIEFLEAVSMKSLHCDVQIGHALGTVEVGSQIRSYAAPG